MPTATSAEPLHILWFTVDVQEGTMFIVVYLPGLEVSGILDRVLPATYVADSCSLPPALPAIPVLAAIVPNDS